MTILDESPGTLRAAQGIVPLVPRCSHRNPDNSTAWAQEPIVMGHAGCGSRWVCSLCGAGDYTQEDFREGVKECVDDRA
ncbi:MAG TPA: hypothetical protein VGG32_02510 [Thermoplasmata archaeon]|jgi:hypothetical protein